MARPLRMEFPGAIYHITSRMLGNWNKAPSRLFVDDQDRSRFLDQLGERVQDFEIRLYLFTLMSNHFHLLLETPQANLSRFMHALTTAYTVYFNRRHRRHGHLLDGRFKAKLVEGDEYLLKLSRYVHLNPVQTGAMKQKPIRERIDALRRYRWSSYPGYIARRQPMEWVAMAPILAMMNGSNRQRQATYRKFVESGLAQDDQELLEAMKQSPLAIGGERFQGQILEMYQQMSSTKSQREDVSFRRMIKPLATEKVLEIVAKRMGVRVEEFKRRRRGSYWRAVAAKMLCRFAGLHQRKVAKELGMSSGSAVSRQLTALRQRLPKDKKLSKQLEDCEKTLQATRAKTHIV